MSNIVETPRRDVSTKFKNIFKISTNRLQGWDYSSAGYYFVTICTYKKKEYFGEIGNGKINLSEIGEIAENELLKTEHIRKNIKIDEYVIMPNHIHVIIVIRNEIKNGTCDTVETHCNASLQNTFGPQSNNLASIVRGYKSSVKRYANKHDVPFHWQSRYYDHIIRFESSYFAIKQYIKDNLMNWSEDEENSALKF